MAKRPTWNALNETLHGALFTPAPLGLVYYNITVYNNYDASQCQAVSASWTTIQDLYVTQLLNKQNLTPISILPAWDRLKPGLSYLRG
jgi:hypothetical protein